MTSACLTSRSRLRLVLGLAALATAGAMLVSTEPASADSDRPDTFVAARAVAPSTTGVWLRSTIDDPGDADWYAFRVSATTRAAVTLGGLPFDYQLAVYDGTGRRVAESKQAGVRFERVFVAVTAGTYYARVTTTGPYAKSKQYSLRFRQLPAGMVALSARGPVEGPQGYVVAELYNNTDAWQWIPQVSYEWRSSTGKLLRRDRGGMLYDLWIVPPHGTAPFWSNGPRPPRGATTVKVIPDASPVRKPAAVPAVSVSGLSRSYRKPRYNPYTLFTGKASSSASRSVDALALAEGWDSYGTLLGWSYAYVRVGAGRVDRFQTDIVAGLLNRSRVVGRVGYGEPDLIQ